MTGITVRRLAWLAVVFAGCALPDYTKVDPNGNPVGSDSPIGGSGDPDEVGECCGGDACADADVLDCVCASDSFCCEEGWDASCAAEIEPLGCGSCSGDAPDPDPGNGPGESCGAAASCEESAPVCVDDTCVQCADDSDCAEHFPGYPVCVEGDCGECVQNTDCDALYAGEYPHCIGGLCAECMEDADCAAGTCIDAACE
jgi:hypothetical protein